MGDSYIAIFLNSSFAAGNYLGPLSLFFLFLGRILPIIAQAPFLGSRTLPHPVKVGFAITLFVIFLPKLLLVTETPLTFNPILLVLLVKEIVIGYIFGFFITIPFIIAQNAGMIVDHQRGGASLMVNDPTIQNQSSPLGTVFNMVLIYLFYVFDGPFLLFDVLLNSYDVLPPDKFLSPHIFSFDSPFGKLEIGLLNKAMIMSIQLATPALMAILMTDVFLGITNRLAPQVQITFLGLPLKSLLGLTVICIGWKLLLTQMVIDSKYWINVIDKMNVIFKASS